jgi:predicted GTPase
MRAPRVLILGATGRGFHNFNVLFRDDPDVLVVGFTAQHAGQPTERRYPAELAGARYPDGIPIFPEEQMEGVIRERAVTEVVLAHADLSHAEVMHLASRAAAAGADFRLVAPERTMLPSRRPVVAVCAARTGAGKSAASRAVVRRLRREGLAVAVIRPPMPLGSLLQQRVQRFSSAQDLPRQTGCVVERDEVEPHLDAGSVVFTGVDYETVLRAAEAEGDVIVWDGGSSDTPFVRPDVHVTLVDPHRAGDELVFHPGETNVRMADVVIVTKVDSAPGTSVPTVLDNVRALNPGALVLEAALPITLDDPSVVRGRRVLAVEDGRTVTDGQMRYGAAGIGARDSGAAELVDPRPFAVGEIADLFLRFPGTGPLLPALGYGERQMRDLEATLARAAAHGVEAVVVGTSADLGRLVRIPLPHTRARFDLAVVSSPSLDHALVPVLARAVPGVAAAPVAGPPLPRVVAPEIVAVPEGLGEAAGVTG